MQLKKMLFATIIGIILYITDMNYGWMSFWLGGVWTIFIIIFIVGILAGDISGGFVAGILTVLLGVGIIAMIPEILLPGYTISATDILSRMWLIMAFSLSYSTRFPDAPIPWIEGLVIIMILIVLAPLVYGIALVFALFGGLIGRFIYPRVFKPKSAPIHVPSQAPQPAPPAPEPPAPEEVPQEEVVEEESEDSSSLESEPSE